MFIPLASASTAARTRVRVFFLFVFCRRGRKRGALAADGLGLLLCCGRRSPPMLGVFTHSGLVSRSSGALGRASPFPSISFWAAQEKVTDRRPGCMGVRACVPAGVCRSVYLAACRPVMTCYRSVLACRISTREMRGAHTYATHARSLSRSHTHTRALVSSLLAFGRSAEQDIQAFLFFR